MKSTKRSSAACLQEDESGRHSCEEMKTTAEIFHRDFHKLFAHKSTFNCATRDLCIPCLYKLFPDGSAFGITLPPNQRPEMCKHSSLDDSECRSIEGLYPSQAQKKGGCDTEEVSNRQVLTIGDGDFSFSLSLAQSLHMDLFVATSYESNESVLSVYKNSLSNIEKLKSFGVIVKHVVDGKNIQGSLAESKYKNAFDYIIWNFPCIRITGGADAQVADIEENKDLVRSFFHSAKVFLRKQSSCSSNSGTTTGGEIHVTHKTFEPFCWWDILALAAEADLVYNGSVVFDRYLYAGYVNRKALDNKSFPFFDAQTYIFTEKICADQSILSGDANGEDEKEKKQDLLMDRRDLIALNDPKVFVTLKTAVCTAREKYDRKQDGKSAHHKSSHKSKKARRV